MKWIIGVDLRETAAGALHFAGWLAENTAGTARPEFVPVHVLEESYLLQVLRHQHIDAVEDLARRAATDQLDRAQIGGLSQPAKIVRGVVADEALVREFDAVHGDALIIGRQAPASERNLVRLGRVARRLVRKLPCPTVVVPPDLRRDAVGKGPIMLATDLEETAGSAARFALRLSHATGRPLVVAHIVPADSDMSRYLPDATVDQFLSQSGLDREKDLKAWMANHGLESAAAIVSHGDVIARLTSIAEVEGSPMIVCGSRGMGTLERMFITSVGTDLSCWARAAVAMVPPTWGQ
ncbi:MAG: universal stress protein [Nannocystaceae bacterium]|nr:universal stress protein [Nannocystaceae bacterium]